MHSMHFTHDRREGEYDIYNIEEYPSQQVYHMFGEPTEAEVVEHVIFSMTINTAIVLGTSSLVSGVRFIGVSCILKILEIWLG